MISLFPELQVEIFRHLDAISLKRALFTSKQFCTIARTQSLWENHLLNINPLPRPKGTLFYDLFLEKKRNEISHIHNPLVQKLFVLVEERDLEAIKTLIPKLGLRITTLLFMSSKKLTFALWINAQKDQLLKDYFFQLVCQEYNDPDRLKAIQLLCSYFEGPYFNMNFVRNSSDPYMKFDENGYSLFHWACVFDQLEFVGRPQFQRLDLDNFFTRECPLKISPLSIACIHGSKRVMENLWTRGASVNFPFRNVSMPLVAAAEHGQLEVMQWLISKNARDNASNLLHKAVRYGHLDVVEFLMNSYPCPDESLKEALIIAVTHAQVNVLKYLFPHAERLKISADDLLEHINLSHPWNDSACCLQFLLEQGGDVNHRIDCFFASYLLIEEAVSGDSNLDAVRVLLAYGVDIEIALKHALKKKNTAVIKLLTELRFASSSISTPLDSQLQ